jgi:predicted metal-dependent HD superfamily phosphohydrolase
MPGLARRWPLDVGAAERDRLLAAYGDPRRGYHDLRHLAEVLDRLDELAAAGEPFDPLTTRLAAWFHDAVYEGTPGDEELSAAWARRALVGLGLPAARVEQVARLVIVTADHRPRPEDADGCALCDADLAVLAAPEERYADYVAGVRREYAHVPEAEFRRGRAAVLRALAEGLLFATRHARLHWEPRARANLRRELSELEQP